MNSNKRLKLSLEPIKLPNHLLPPTHENEDEEEELFLPPIKLLDVNLEDSKEIFIR